MPTYGGISGTGIIVSTSRCEPGAEVHVIVGSEEKREVTCKSGGKLTNHCE